MAIAHKRKSHTLLAKRNKPADKNIFIMLGHTKAFSLKMFLAFLETDGDYRLLREPLVPSVWTCNPLLFNMLQNLHFL